MAWHYETCARSVLYVNFVDYQDNGREDISTNVVGCGLCAHFAKTGQSFR